MIPIIQSLFRDHVKANQFVGLMRFAISLLISILLVRSAYTDQAVGQFEYLILIAYTASFFWIFAYGSGILSKLGEVTSKGFSAHLTQVFWQLMIIALIMGLITFIIISFFSSFGKINLDLSHKWLIPIFVFSLIAGSLPETIFILYRKAKDLMIFAFILYGVQLILVILCIWFSWPINTLIGAYICIQLFRVVLSYILIRPKWSIDLKLQKSWFIFIIPLVLHFILGSGMDYLDGHLIASYFDDETFLYYRYGARELPLSLILINAMTAAMIGVLAKDITQIGVLKERIDKLMNYLFPISMVFLFISPFIFQWVYGQEFILSAFIFNIYILIISSRILVPQLIMYAKKDNKMLMIFSGIELLFNLVLSLILLEVIGIFGVPIATVIAFLLNRILSVFFVKSRHGIQVGEYIDIKKYCLYLGALLVGFFTSAAYLFDYGI